ncbi:MAG: MBL fold metallo-hydrolase [Actinomycetota bacterium]|nr:MBL fold metallo-hydrolase [Actinomycetota bacterium]
MRIEFFGVRGSCPCPAEQTRRYGGNTACVVLSADGEAPLLLDLGTGLRAFGLTQPTDGSFAGSALVTHVHWDHVQGLPFFPPVDRTGASLDVYGPTQEGCSFAEALGHLVRPPYFPVTVGELRGRVSFHDLGEGELAVGGARVTARLVPHPGPTFGYRVSWDGVVVTYISDLQAPRDLESIPEVVLELASGADVLVLDAQYTAEEFGLKSTWGHCTVGYSLAVATAAGAKTLVLFHHDPDHDDDRIDQLVAQAQAASGPGGPEVLAAYEGLVIER